MTLYGIDISNNNSPALNLNQVAQEGFSWVEAKVSEGNYFQDTTWPGYLSAAQAAGLPIIGYHYAISSCTPASQVQTFVGNGGGAQVMIDFEANSGTITDYWNLVDAFNSAGVGVALTYLPNWYWQQIGRPDLSQVPGLVASDYPVSGSGYASDLYGSAGGDAGPGWAAYGNGAPQIWQFTNSAAVAGESVDADAFRGTAGQLTDLLTGRTDMQLSDTLTDAYGNPLTVADAFKWISYHADLVVDGLGGIGSRQNLPPNQKNTGHPCLAGHDVVTALAAIGQKLGLAGFDPAQPE
ncbi:GH25 family lysozyme [Nocardia sp. NPDC020380]|uniref:GH25 family lysozyme n=1 Tax=Nocardia sp. NPDC020380 TaxID=3364309 RepID=UPI0037B85B1D